MNDRERIGQQVAELRKGAGMTQYELATAAGIDVSNLSKIERGVYNVSIDILNRVCAAMGAKVTIE